MRRAIRCLQAGWIAVLAVIMLFASGGVPVRAGEPAAPRHASRFVRASAPPVAPPAVGGTVRVASANVDNFFSTLADGAHGCAPGGMPGDCRGARGARAFERQRAALAAEIAGLDADVVGLMEIENDGPVTLAALLQALDARVGAGVYAAVDDPRQGTGTDAIKVALVYRPARVRPVGPSRSDPSRIHNRAPLAQTFEVAPASAAAAGSGTRFTVVVSHFKSKLCDGAAAADHDGDAGRGCWNARRVAQAGALRAFVADVERRSRVGAILLVGDFNAGPREAPVALLERAGFVDVVERFDPAGYTYVHDGVAGRLDHMLASASLAAHVTGAAAWHINAGARAAFGPAGGHDPPCADAACAVDPRAALPYGASDHDPLLVGLRFDPG